MWISCGYLVEIKLLFVFLANLMYTTIMDMQLTQRLDKIEEILNRALPEHTNSNWQNISFGELKTCITDEHLTNLITPNKNLITLGGKRWRPLFLILCYEMAKKLSSVSTAKASTAAAAFTALTEDQAYSLTPLVEFVHTASLIHDDIEDSADLRRGKPAAHITYGLDTALNAATWLYFEAPVCINSLEADEKTKLRLYQIYTNELRRLHLGQAMDIYWHKNPSAFPTQEQYTSMVKCKTGTLASLAAKIGCTTGGLDQKASDDYGKIAAEIGIGFQIIDDVINLTTGNAGKKRGDDIVEGKKSLPVLLHVQSKPNDKSKIAELMETAAKEGIDSPAVETCISLLQTSNCIEAAAVQGRDLILTNCKLFDSELIKELFTAMIPKKFI